MFERLISMSKAGRGRAARMLAPVAAAGLLLATACGGGDAFDASTAAPTLKAQPQSVAVRSTQPATFTVSAEGSPAPTYLWQKDGRDIPGANSATYTLPATTVADVGSYRAVVRNDYGSVVSAAATLTVQQTVQFAEPAAVAKDAAGALYVANSREHTICKVQPGGAVTVLAGAPGQAGYADGAAASARFSWPTGLCVDAAGSVYVADGNNVIRVISPAGIVSTLAGTAGQSGSLDGTGAAARFGGLLQALAFDLNGDLLVTDTHHHTLRRVTTAGAVSTIAGIPLQAGKEDGALGVGRLNGPSGVAVASNGTIYLADYGNHTIRALSPAGALSTVAGTAGTRGQTDGTGTAALFAGPTGLAVDGSNRLWIADTLNHTLRRMEANGAVTTAAGGAGTQGDVDGAGTVARFYRPMGLFMDGSATLYVADAYNGTVRLVSSTAAVSTLVQTP